ncbi:MAG: aspartate aminotransferase family protein [Clostridiales Family XIII bacterium]|jgi:4-aminobutyrate aminotransferase|nr:aspartate aminotransferase family protein [Clostridiales Family XIII bacterium]
MKFADYKPYLSPALAKTTDLVMDSAKGFYITDLNGDKYIDLVQGIAVNALGHCHPNIVKAIQDQAAKLIDASFNLVSYPTTLELAKRISELAPGDLSTVFFSNGGSEANDGAIKLAKAVTGRPCIIAYRGSFHGRSIGATSITGSNSKYRKHYEPLMGGVYFAPYPNPYRWGTSGEAASEEVTTREALNELQIMFDQLVYPEDVAAIIIEPVLGEGGYVVPPKAYLEALRGICDKYGILLIFDEIQSGYGRTGKMFASEHFGVVPDVMTLGKAIAGGLPMSAIVSTEEIMSKWLPGMHGTTFGGHPVCAAAALAVLDTFKEENILENCTKVGEYLKSRLFELKEKYPVIGDVRGLGLMLAMEFINPEDRSPNAEAFNKVRQYCLDNKMLILGCGVYGNGFRIATPLNVTKDEVDQVLSIVDKALAAL